MIAKPPGRRHSFRPRSRGVALVLVLGVMALIAFLVLTILTLNRSEQRAAKNSAELTDVRTLADLPVQIVTSQIRRATQDLRGDFNWTSQPGMIRVYAMEAPSGNEETAPRLQQYRYALYSTDTLYATGPLDLARETQTLARWAEAKALFVDLNEPIEIRQNLSTGRLLPPAQRGTLVYPILDPSAFEPMGNNGQSRIEGMRLLPNGAAPPTRHHGMPMPVRWLYVLSNGRVLTPLPSSGPTQARFNMRDFQPEGNEPAPRIVGRIAFWTDDESCKVNLNTATEPAPWHPPMTLSSRDRWAADTQPVRGENHRLSAHPAYTALSPVFRGFGGMAGPTPVLQPQPQPPNALAAGATLFRDFVNASHALLPHAPQAQTGSLHGTEMVVANTTPPLLQRRAGFATVDDLLFDSGLGGFGGVLRNRNGFQAVNGYPVDEADIRRARFALTTRSSAPETNPFNQPKISLWPVQEDPALRTRTDHLMALAASLGGPASARFYYGLQRQDRWTSPASPGSVQSSSQDLTGIPRNQQLLTWLRARTANPFAITGESFEQKYGALNRDQLLLSMFDLMRWTGNPGNAWTDNGPTYDYLPPSTEGLSPHPGTGMVSPLVADIGSGRTLRGPGRVPTITEAAIVFVATDAERDSNGAVRPETTQPDWMGFGARTTRMRAFIVLEPYVPSPGFPSVSPHVRYVLKGLNGENATQPDPSSADFAFDMSPAQVNGRPLFFGGNDSLYDLANITTFSPSLAAPVTMGGTSRRFGGDATSFTGLTSLFVRQDGSGRIGFDPANPQDHFAWASNGVALEPATLPQPDPNTGMILLPFQMGDLVLEIRHAVTDEILQEIALPFRLLSNAIPMPRLAPEDFDLATGGDDAVLLERFKLQADPASPATPPYLPLIKRGDVVRSVTLNPDAPHRGDVRVVAARYQVPREWFGPVMPTASLYEAHGLRETPFDQTGQIGSNPEPQPAGSSALASRRPPETTVGSLFPLPPAALPLPPYDSLPQQVNGALARSDFGGSAASGAGLRYGDWETGYGGLPDGPFFSRQDLLTAVAQEDSNRGAYDTAAGAYTDGGQMTVDAGALSHTPQRQVPSAFIFGALSPWIYGLPGSTSSSSGTPDPEPWRTLLFCPNPASRTTPFTAVPTVQDHPGFLGSPDHLWLEFFWTPVVEPQFLSAAFATEGKVNLNYQMIPFTWIERSTALHAAFKGVRIPAIPHQAKGFHKPILSGAPSPPLAQSPEFLYEVDTQRTLPGLQSRFARGETFIHPSEICGVPFMPRRIPGFEVDYDRGLPRPPADPSAVELQNITEWWNGDASDPLQLDAFELTGDNLRESPYAQVYPRLCTRSNVFKVHYRVQLVTHSRSSVANEWNLETERITAEQRGATVIERYLDPNDPLIPDFATDNVTALEDFYRYRVITTEPFTP